MERLLKENCVPIGFFHKTYRYEGTLQLNFDPSWESSLISARVLLTETDGMPVPWFVADDGVRITSPGIALVDLKWIDDEKSAKKLVGLKVMIEKNAVKDCVEPESPAGWTGYSLEESLSGYVGLITDESNYSGNIVLTVKRETGNILIPFHPDFLISANHHTRILILKLPQGLF